jgi:hypothetical protein
MAICAVVLCKSGACKRLQHVLYTTAVVNCIPKAARALRRCSVMCGSQLSIRICIQGCCVLRCGLLTSKGSRTRIVCYLYCELVCMHCWRC